MSFLTEYFNRIEGEGEQAVLCPFDHHSGNDDIPDFKESNPSMHINTDKNLYHCKSCLAAGNDADFIREILGLSEKNVKKIQEIFSTQEYEYNWQKECILNEETKAKILSLGISEQVMNELQLKTHKDNEGIMFPVFMHRHLCDIRTYRPGKNPKIVSRTGALSGLIIPYDLWINSDPTKATIICAGEKDMAVARSNGLNAITFTGGEMSNPILLKCFTNKKVIIAYDNDGAGIDGGKKLAHLLYPYTNKIKILTNFHKICKEKGEDITDYFVKYKQTLKDFTKLAKETPLYTYEEELKTINIKYPEVTLYEASQSHLNKLVRSNIQVIATSDKSYPMPSYITAKKLRVSEGPR